METVSDRTIRRSFFCLREGKLGSLPSTQGLENILLLTVAVFIELKRKMKQDQADW